MRFSDLSYKRLNALAADTVALLPLGADALVTFINSFNTWPFSENLSQNQLTNYKFLISN